VRIKLEDGVPTANSFAQQIEEMVSNAGIGYMEAVVAWCQTRGIEPEIGGELVKKSAALKLKIQTEAEDLRFLPRGNRLPL
jgi:hypothetical protein